MKKMYIKFKFTIFLFMISLIISNCGLVQKKDNSGDYFNRYGDNNFVDSVLLQFKEKPNELFELESQYMINSSFDMFYVNYLKEVGKMGVLLDKKTRLYITKFNYTLNDKIKSEIEKNPNKYPSSFINTLKNNLPLYLFITSYDVNYSGGNRFGDEGFKKSQIGKSWGMANYGGGQGKIYSINLMYVDNDNSIDKIYKLSSYNTNNKFFGFIEIGKVSSQYSGVLEVENNGELKSPSFNYMKYEYSIHLNDKISKEFNKDHFDNSENSLIINLFSENNKFNNIDDLIKNCKYTFFAEHFEINSTSDNSNFSNTDTSTSIETEVPDMSNEEPSEIKLSKKGPIKVDITKEFNGLIKNVIQYDGDYFFILEDTNEGNIEIYFSTGSCHNIEDKYQFTTEMTNDLKKKIEENTLGPIKLKVTCKSTYGNFCNNDGYYKSIVWRPLRIETY